MKRYISMTLVFVLLLTSFPFSASATSTSPDNLFIEDGVNYYRIWENPDLENEDTSGNPNPRYGEREYWTVINEAQKVIYTTPSGQPAGGYSFETGGGVYVNTSGGPNLSVSVSLAWNDSYSVSLNVGYANTSGVGGIFVTFPASTTHYLVKLRHTYKFEYLKVDCYQGPNYINTYYTTRRTLLYIDAYLVPTD